MIGRSLFGPDGGHGNAHFRQIELRFDEEQIHAAFHKAARLFAQGFIQLKPGAGPRAGRTNCPHGPMSPATKASRPAASTAARAIRAIVRLNGVTSMPAGSLRREPPKVHVRMMSAPAAR